VNGRPPLMEYFPDQLKELISESWDEVSKLTFWIKTRKGLEINYSNPLT